MSIIVIEPGLQSTVQAGPRVGYRHWGVPASGAADPLSLALANKLVGNPPLAPGLEAVLTGPTLHFGATTCVAITGAEVCARLNDIEVPQHRAMTVREGDRLRIGAVTVGARVYIAIAGGVQASRVLGSTSTYLPAKLGGFEGRALSRDDHLLLGTPTSAPVERETPPEFRPPLTRAWALRASPSADLARIADEESARLFDTNWQLGRRADRMGLELKGPKLSVRADGRLPSSPVFPGTLQCPEGGTPFLLGADAQTTGGYARLLQVARADRHLIGQLRPGDSLRFLPRQPAEAVAALRAKHDYWREWLPDIESVI